MSRRTQLASVLALCLAAPCALAAPVTQRLQSGAEPNGTSATPAVSADGTVVAFVSIANNLVADPTTGSLYAYDLATRGFSALLPYGQAQTPTISQDGRYVAFTTDANGLAPGIDSQFSDILRVDRSDGSITRATRGFGGVGANGPSETPAISGDGRWVAFTSLANNLVAPSTTANRRHIYLTDMSNGFVELVTRSPDFAEGDKDAQALEANAMASDGNRLVFTTGAENVAPVFAGNVSDVIVRTRDPQSGTVTYQNVNRSVAGAVGTQSSSRGTLSPNGRYVAFRSSATNIVTNQAGDSDLFVRDLQLDTLRALPAPPGFSACNRARVTDFGDVLMQCAPDAGSTALQLFFVPATGGAPRLVTRASGTTTGGNGSSGQSFTLDASGVVIALESAATNLVAQDGNVVNDVFVVAESALLDGLFRDGFE
jgi:Tol biopolymer transport system component